MLDLAELFLFNSALLEALEICFGVPFLELCTELCLEVCTEECFEMLVEECCDTLAEECCDTLVEECLVEEADIEAFFTDVFREDDLEDPLVELSFRNSFAELRDFGGDADLDDTLDDFLLEPTEDVEDFLRNSSLPD